MEAKSIPAFTIMPKVCSPDTYAVFLSPKQLQRLGVSPGNTKITVAVRTHQIQAQLVVHPQPAHLIQMSLELFRALHLYPGVSMQIILGGDNYIWLGPIIAVMVSDTAWNHLSEGKGVLELTVPAQWCRDEGFFIYYFSVHEILWQDRIIKGTFFNPITEQWEVGWMPFPDVIYDQATFSKKPEYLERAKDMLSRFRKDETIQVINQRRYFGKWEIAQCLSFFGTTRKYIPHSVQLHGTGDLDQMLTIWKAIFVKGEYGSYGQQVAWVSKREHCIGCQFGGPQGEYAEFNNTAELYEAAKKRFGTETIMAQQAIDIAKIKGRRFDLRIIVQKNESGNWQMNLVALRIAPSDSFVTNISSGGDELVIEKTDFTQYFRYLTWHKLEKASLECVTALESHYGLHGEIGLDFGVEDDGTLWLFEANSKPSTMDYLKLARKDTAHRLYMQPFRYSGYLTRRFVNGLHPVKSFTTLPSIKLSETLCQKLGIGDFQKIVIKIGSAQRQAIVNQLQDIDQEQDYLALTRFWGLPEPVSWNYEFYDNELALGPVSSLEVDFDLFLHPDQLSKLNVPVCYEGLFYAYCAEDIDYANSMVAGYQLAVINDKPTWVRGLFPLTKKEDNP